VKCFAGLVGLVGLVGLPGNILHFTPHLHLTERRSSFFTSAEPRDKHGSAKFQQLKTHTHIAGF
jgi:hypothetical protein